MTGSRSSSRASENFVSPSTLRAVKRDTSSRPKASSAKKKGREGRSREVKELNHPKAPDTRYSDLPKTEEQAGETLTPASNTATTSTSNTATTSTSNTATTSASTSLEECWECVTRVRYFWWWVLGALLLALASVLAATVFRDVRIGPISMIGLFFWLELSWLALWALYFVTLLIGMVWKGLCQFVPFGIFDYRDFLDDLKVPLTLLLWAIVSWAIVPALCHFDHGDCIVGWISIFRTVLLAILVGLAIYFAKCFVVEIIRIKADHGFLSPRRQEIIKTISAINLLMLNPEEEKGSKKSKEETKRIVWKTLWCMVVNPSLTNIEKYVYGLGDKKSYAAVHDEILESFHLKKTAPDIELTRDKINERRISKNKVKRWHQDPRDYIFESITELMRSLGAANNNKLCKDDLNWLIKDIGVALETVAKGEECIRKVVGHLDFVLTLLVLAGIALVFVAFFISNFSNYLTPLWATFTGLGFALQGTVQEYLASCTFVFSQHPYDIGDRVALDNGPVLIVEDIRLAYTTFRGVENGRVSQIRHSELCKKKVENLSRSNIQCYRDTFSIESRIADSKPEDIKNRLNQYVESIEDIRIDRYFEYSIQIEPGQNKAEGLEIKKLCVDMFCKPRIGAAYEVLLSACQQRMREGLHSGLPEPQITEALQDNKTSPIEENGKGSSRSGKNGRIDKSKQSYHSTDSKAAERSEW